MAKFNAAMRAHVAGSMDDRPAPEGSSGASRFTANRPGIHRQSEGRRRLEAAALIRIDRIIADPDQPRTEFEPDSLEALASSLREKGQLMPIRVRWVESADRYVIVAGERRYRAAIQAGLEALQCVVADGELTPEDVLEDQLVENALREDLKPVEQARAYLRLIEARGYSTRELGERLRISHPSIVRALSLVKLPPEIQLEVDAGRIAPNTAYELSKVRDPGEQAELAREAAGGKLRRDDIAARARTPRKPTPAAVHREPLATPSGEDRPGAAAVHREPTRRTFRTSMATVAIESDAELAPAEMAAALREVLEQLGEGEGDRG